MPTRCNAGHGVGRGVAHACLVVEHHHAVADAWRSAGVADQPVERERPFGDHRRKSLEDPQIGALELARLPAGAVRPLARQHRDRLVAVAHRDGQHARRLGQQVDSDLALGDLAGLERRCQQRPLVVGGHTDIVGEVDRLAGGRADLGNDQPLGIGRRNVQQQIGEAQVGEQAPLADQLFEMIDLVASQRRVLPAEFAQRCHAIVLALIGRIHAATPRQAAPRSQPPKPILRSPSGVPISTYAIFAEETPTSRLRRSVNHNTSTAPDSAASILVFNASRSRSSGKLESELAGGLGDADAYVHVGPFEEGRAHRRDR